MEAYRVPGFDRTFAIKQVVIKSYWVPVQNVLNAAARIILRKRKFNCITADIGCPFSRNEYKVCVLVYKCLHEAVPTCLAEMVTVTSVSASVSQRHLRSAAHSYLVVPCVRTTRYEQRSFAVSGPTFWNSLLPTVSDSELTLTQFCALLNTAPFYRAYETLP